MGFSVLADCVSLPVTATTFVPWRRRITTPWIVTKSGLLTSTGRSIAALPSLSLRLALGEVMMVGN